MKIERFNESEFSKNLSDEINDYITNFDDSVDIDIPSWIDSVSEHTNLKEYKNIFSSINKSLKFAYKKNLKKFEKYCLSFKEIENLEKKIETLKNNKDILYKEAINELLYKFQEDLINNDIKNFKLLFIEDRSDEDDKLSDIHPDIIKKYSKEIEVIIDTEKYNL